jgi:uncharacterized protein (TIGR03435 family)
MLRALLIDRFQMKTHYENRPTNAYSLVAVKPKLKKGDPAVRASCEEARTVAHDPRDANPRLVRLISCRNATMAQFASKLQGLAPNYFAYDVADATGMSGGWDFTLSFTPSWMLSPAPDGGQAGGASGPSDPDGAISLFAAIRKQLGLKLEMRKRVLPVVVIDHMEEKPTEN